jgi:hypothetical protein
MRFGIDLDGVLANFGAKVVEIGNKRWPGKFPKDYVPDNWNYEGYLTKEEWAQIWIDIKATPHFWGTLAELPGLVDLQRAVNLYPQSLHDEIYFITAREKTYGDSPLVQSAEWLSIYGLYPRQGHSVVIPVAASKEKAFLFRALGVKFMLDDYAPTVEALNNIKDDDDQQFMQAYVLDQPWNRYAKDLPRVFSVEEYLKTIHEQ